VRDDGAEHSGNVTGSEGDNELLSLGAVGPGLGHNVLVQELDRALEAGELHHGVGDLATPERHQGLVEAVDAFSSVDLGGCFPQGGGEGSDGAGN